MFLCVVVVVGFFFFFNLFIIDLKYYSMTILVNNIFFLELIKKFKSSN